MAPPREGPQHTSVPAERRRPDMISGSRRCRDEEVLHGCDSADGGGARPRGTGGPGRGSTRRRSLPVARGGPGREGPRLGEEQNAKTTALLEARPEYKPIYARTLEILDSKEKIPTPELLGETVYNFWKDDAHERGIWRRTSLASYRTAAPQWETVLDVDALAKADGKAVGVQGRDLPAARLRALHDAALARRLRRVRRARVRHEHEAVRRRRLLAARGQVQRGVAGRGHALGRDRLRARVADGLRLPADREALEARHAAPAARTVFEGRPEDVASSGDDRDPERRALRPRHADPGVLPAGDVPAPRRPPREARPARGRAAARLLPRPAPLLAAQRLDRRRQDVPRGLAPRRAPSTTSCAASAASTCSSSRPSASRSAAWTGRATAC